MPRPQIGLFHEFRPDDQVGIAISFSAHQNHLGCLYRLDRQRVRQVHLANHLDLRDEELSGNFQAWVTPNYPLKRLEQVAALARRFVKRHRDGRIGYGFDQPFEAIRRDGSLQPDLVGLTCASFVVGLFNTAGLPVVDEVNWPRDPADDSWQANIAGLISRRHPEQAQRLIQQNGKTRYRPSLVFAAGCVDLLPASKEGSVERLGTCLLELQNSIVCALVLKACGAGYSLYVWS